MNLKQLAELQSRIPDPVERYLGTVLSGETPHLYKRTIDARTFNELDRIMATVMSSSYPDLTSSYPDLSSSYPDLTSRYPDLTSRYPTPAIIDYIKLIKP